MTPLYLLAEKHLPFDDAWKLYSDEYLRWHLHSGFVVGGVSEDALDAVKEAGHG